jgi:hypothetical protein
VVEEYCFRREGIADTNQHNGKSFPYNRREQWFVVPGLLLPGFPESNSIL